MRRLFAALLMSLAIPGFARSAESSFALINGTVSREEAGGTRRIIDVGKRCIDLWVAPDESVVAFTAIDTEGGGPDPLIRATSIYIAEASTDYSPVRIPLDPVKIGDRSWSLFRYPSLSPDRHVLYFAVPYTMITLKVLSTTLNAPVTQTVGDAVTFCVLWGGTHSGSLLLQERVIPHSADTGIVYPCDLRYGNGEAKRLTKDCWDFEAFARTWAKAHGATCTMPTSSTPNW